jgi:hypothetical protein
MHENLLFAAIRAQHSEHLGAWRLESNGAYALLIADVTTIRVERFAGGQSRTKVKLGEVWIGGDEPGGISGYLNINLGGEGDGNPFDSVPITHAHLKTRRGEEIQSSDPDAVRSPSFLGDDLINMIGRMVRASEHKITLTRFHLGLHGDQDVFYFTIDGREGAFHYVVDGEVFDHQGMPTIPRYADGEDATNDLLKLTREFSDAYDAHWGTWNLDTMVESAAGNVLARVNNH